MTDLEHDNKQNGRDGIDRTSLLPSDNISLACCEFSERVAEKKKELALLNEIIKTLTCDYGRLVSALADNDGLLFGSDPNAAFKKIEEAINTLKEKGVSDKGISLILKELPEYIADGIQHAAQNNNFTHIIKLSELLDQYGFTKDDIVGVFEKTDLKRWGGSDFIKCIEAILEKDIDSLQKFTQFLGKGDCNLRHELKENVYSYCSELIDVMKEDPYKAIEIISLLERIGLSESAKSEIFERALHRAIHTGDKDLISKIIENEDINQLLLDHREFFWFSLDEIVTNINNSQAYGLTKDDIRDFLNTDLGKKALKANFTLLLSRCEVEPCGLEKIIDIKIFMKQLEELGLGIDDKRELFLNKEVSKEIGQTMGLLLILSRHFIGIDIIDNFVGVLKENGLSNSDIGKIIKDKKVSEYLKETIRILISSERISDVDRLDNILKRNDFSIKDVGRIFRDKKVSGTLEGTIRILFIEGKISDVNRLVDILKCNDFSNKDVGRIFKKPKILEKIKHAIEIAKLQKKWKDVELAVSLLRDNDFSDEECKKYQAAA